MNKILLFMVSLLTILCQSQTPVSVDKKAYQEAIIKEHVYDCADKINYTVMMKEYQDCLNTGLKKDSTIAYLWQQKAMPYFKVKKYEVGMVFMDKAVKLNPERWQPYRAFIKCIFQKSYKEAIIDFEDCKKKWGNQYEMDHTYDFYIALSNLQLNEFTKAEKLFKNYIDDIYKNRGKLEHPTAYFYYGISLYEQNKWEEAVSIFDKAIKIYTNFSDAKWYKAICLARLNKQIESSILLKEAREDAKKGYTINEDNTAYEVYPYQKKWN